MARVGLMSVDQSRDLESVVQNVGSVGFVQNVGSVGFETRLFRI